jgi:N-methylhydantoinase B
VQVIRADGSSVPPFGKASRFPLRRGDLVRLVTGSGGGYGDPHERDPALVRADLRDEVITAREAADVYGMT